MMKRLIGLDPSRCTAVSFPTLMLMEIIDEFATGYSERQKKQFDVTASDEELQKKYAEASTKWNEKLN